MHHHYDCITRRIIEHPRWFDENGVPRYDLFEPRLVANIYAEEALLLGIKCQVCSAEFIVAMSGQLARMVKAGEIHYGDPPNTGCCGSGPTMSSVPVVIFEFWRRDRSIEAQARGGWTRVRELEILVEERTETEELYTDLDPLEPTCSPEEAANRQAAALRFLASNAGRVGGFKVRDKHASMSREDLLREVDRYATMFETIEENENG